MKSHNFRESFEDVSKMSLEKISLTKFTQTSGDEVNLC